eukprot:gene30756-38525_t
MTDLRHLLRCIRTLLPVVLESEAELVTTVKALDSGPSDDPSHRSRQEN